MPRFCGKCGAALTKSAAFCSRCGAASNGEESNPPRSRFASLFRPSPPVHRTEHVIIHRKEAPRTSAFSIIGVLVIVILIWAALRDDTKPQSAPSPSPTPPNASPTSPAIHSRRPGEEFSVGYWTYICYGASWKSGLAFPSGEIKAPDAKFLVVDLSISNHDRTSSTFPLPKLIDAQGREYDETSEAALMPGAFDPLKQLNPGVSSRGYVIFDVPQGNYSLRVSGGFESSEYGTIDLADAHDQAQSDEQAQKPSPAIAVIPPETGETITDADPNLELKFNSGTRLIIHLISTAVQPNGSSSFRGKLLLPITSSSGVMLDQSTEVVGEEMPGNGTTIMSVKRLTVAAADYELAVEESDLSKQAGTGTAIELKQGETVEMFLATDSTYKRKAS